MTIYNIHYQKSVQKTAGSQFFTNIPGEHSVFSLLNSYHDLNFDVLHVATGKRGANDNEIRFVNLGSISIFSRNDE